MEQKATIKNKKTGKPYEVTRSQWDTIRKNPGFAQDYEMVKDFPPMVTLADLPEVQALNNPPALPEEPAQPADDLPADPPADEPTGKPGKSKRKKEGDE